MLDSDIGRIRSYDGLMGIPDEGVGMMNPVDMSEVLLI